MRIERAPGGANQNLSKSTAYLGRGVSGAGTVLTSGAGINVVGSYVSLGVAPADASGFTLEFGNASTSAASFMFSIRKGASTIIVPPFFDLPGVFMGRPFFFPLNILSGEEVWMAIQADDATPRTVNVAMELELRQTNSPPAYSSLEAINTNPAATRPSSQNVPYGDETLSWTTLKAATDHAYGGLIASFRPAATPSAAQVIGVQVGVGAAQARIREYHPKIATSAPFCVHGVSKVWEMAIPAGEPIYGRVLATTPGGGPDNGLIGLWGLLD